METNWLSVVAYEDKCVAVHAGLSTTSPETLLIKGDFDWLIDTKRGASSYDQLYRKSRNYIISNNITDVVLKAGTFGPDGRAKGSLIAASELRGVLMAAAITICPVRQMNKAVISRTYGSKMFNEYLRDASFWTAQITGDLRKNSREAAMFMIAAISLIGLSSTPLVPQFTMGTTADPI